VCTNVDALRRGGRGVGVFATEDVRQGGGVSKKSVFARTSLMDDPLIGLSYIKLMFNYNKKNEASIM